VTPSTVISVLSESPASSFRMQSVHACCITTQTTVTPQPRQLKFQIPEGQNAPSVLRNVSVPDHLLMEVSYHFAYMRRFSIPPTEVMGNIFCPVTASRSSPLLCLWRLPFTLQHAVNRTAFRAYCVTFNKCGITIYDCLLYSTAFNFYISV
jgi:hypothetical protein